MFLRVVLTPLRKYLLKHCSWELVNNNHHCHWFFISIFIITFCTEWCTARHLLAVLSEFAWMWIDPKSEPKFHRNCQCSQKTPKILVTLLILSSWCLNSEQVSRLMSHLITAEWRHQKIFWRFDLSENEKIRQIGNFAKKLIYLLRKFFETRLI